MTVDLAQMSVINGLIKRQGQAITIINQAVQRSNGQRTKRHPESCDCFHCRNNRKWERRFEELHGEEMRAYYAPKEPRAGVSAGGLKEAGHYTFTSSENMLANRHFKRHR